MGEQRWCGGAVVQYNLALVARHVSAIDNGRILGYDNAHGRHERHFMGKVKPVAFTSYGATAKRFFREVDAWRKRQ